MTCFCGETATYRCSWMVERPVKLPYAAARPGDTYLDGRRKGTIVEIIPRPVGAGVTFVVKFPGRLYGEMVQLGRMTPGARHWFETLRLVPCGEWVCDRHVRELSEERHLCRTHWSAWEAA